MPRCSSRITGAAVALYAAGLPAHHVAAGVHPADGGRAAQRFASPRSMPLRSTLFAVLAVRHRAEGAARTRPALALTADGSPRQPVSWLLASPCSRTFFGTPSSAACRHAGRHAAGHRPLAGISILLPITFGLDATKAIIMLAGIYYGSQYGGSTTSILLRIPGEASSVMTCIDGHAMAKKGRAGAALCIAAVGSFIAGTLRRDHAHGDCAAAGDVRVAVRPAGIHRAAGARAIFLAYMLRHSLPAPLLMASFGLLLGTHRHRQDERAFPLQVRPCRAGRRHRRRAGDGRSVRAWRNTRHAEPNVSGNVITPRLRDLLPTARGMASGTHGRSRAARCSAF